MDVFGAMGELVDGGETGGAVNVESDDGCCALNRHLTGSWFDTLELVRQRFLEWIDIGVTEGNLKTNI